MDQTSKPETFKTAIMMLEWKPIDSFKGNKKSETLMTYRPCPNCLLESQYERTILQFNDFQFYSDSSDLPKRADIRIVQCLSCFSIYLNPCFSEIGFEVLSAEAGRSYGASEGRAREQIEWMRENGLLRRGELVLDVGCYDGKFLGQLPRDMKRVGVDVDQVAIERARRKFNNRDIDFILGKLESFKYEKSPDVITMSMVLEHLPQPIAVLKNLKSMSKSNTRLFVEVPILENGDTNDICGFLSAWHTTHFSRGSLRSCLEKAGWEVKKWREQKEYNGCRVIAQPAKEKQTTVNSGDIELAHRYLSNWHLSIVEVEKILQTTANVQRFVIWGGGLHTEFIYQATSFFQMNPEREYIIVDNDPLKEGKSWRGLSIYSPTVLAMPTLDAYPVIVSTYGSQDEIVQAARKMGVSPDRLIRLYRTVSVH